MNSLDRCGWKGFRVPSTSKRGSNTRAPWPTTGWSGAGAAHGPIAQDDLVPGVTNDHLPYVPLTAFTGVPRPIASYHANPLRATSIFLEPFTPHACAASATDITCWGTKGTLDPANRDIVTVEQTYEPQLTGIIRVAHRSSPVCALWQSGERRVVSCWRENETPTEVDWPRSAGQPIDVRMGEYPLCVLDSFGELYCWKATVFGRYWQKHPVHVTWPGKKPTIAFATGKSEVCLVGTGRRRRLLPRRIAGAH